MFQKSWVRIPVAFVCLKRPKINEKEAEDGPFLKKPKSLTASLKRYKILPLLHEVTFKRDKFHANKMECK